MLRLLLIKILRRISLHFIYIVWVRSSAAALVLWAAYLVDSAWFAQAALSVLLIVLLVGGILLLVAGMKDLVRDFWNFLHPRPH